MYVLTHVGMDGHCLRIDCHSQVNNILYLDSFLTLLREVDTDEFPGADLTRK